MSLTSLTMSIQSNSALQNSSISEDTPLLTNELQVIIIAGRGPRKGTTHANSI